MLIIISILSIVIINFVIGYLNYIETLFIVSLKFRKYGLANQLPKKVFIIVSDINRIVTTVQIMISCLTYLSAIIVTDVFLSSTNKFLNLYLDKLLSGILSFICITLLISYISIIVCEVIPKRIALLKGGGIGIKNMYVLYIFYTILYPLVHLSLRIINFVSNKKIFKRMSKNADTGITVDDTKLMIRTNTYLSLYVKSAIDEILDFDSKIVESIMIPRVNIEYINDDSNLREILEFIKDKTHSRYPVVHDNDFNNIIGFIHIKDIFNYYYLNSNRGLESLSDISVNEFLRKPYFVSSVISIQKALILMQRDRVQFAIVQNEYSENDGIVTLEDIMEHIFGNIYDEHDTYKVNIYKDSSDDVIINGNMRIKFIEDYMQTELGDFPYSTVTGYFIYILNRLPNEGDVVNLGKEYTIEALKVEENSVSKAKISKS